MQQASVAELTAQEKISSEGWVADEQSARNLAVLRDPVPERRVVIISPPTPWLRAGERFGSCGSRLIISVAAHLIIPVCIVTAMVRPEKVALMDGTESLIISPLVPVEESKEIMETLSLWAAKSFLDRGPQGFDAPETLQRVFLPEAAKKAEAEFGRLRQNFQKRIFTRSSKLAGLICNAWGREW